MNAPYNAIIIAKYFIRKASEEKLEKRKKITNLKLQKLLYYAQGWYLANFDGKRLFDDEIEAWKYGPAVRSVYREFSKFGAGAIDVIVTDQEIDQIDKDTQNFLNELWGVYGKYTASDLVMATHQETSWINARNYSEEDREISVNDMQESFKLKMKT